MTTLELDNWFCSLSVKQKEHISCKVLLKEGKENMMRAKVASDYRIN